MRHWWKAGMLIVLLVIPASVFLFLQGFGTNHYSLKTYYPLIDSTNGQPIVRKKQQYDREVNDTLFHTIPAYSFTDQYGKPFDSRLTEGKIHVASFFSTRCRNGCPKIATALSRVQDLFLDSPEVLLLSYTLDPANDSLPVLQRYAEQYGAKRGQWYFLTGRPEAIGQLARQGYFIPVQPAQNQTESPDGVLIHSERLVLVDPYKRIRGYYEGTDPKEIERLMLEMRILLNEQKNKPNE